MHYSTYQLVKKGLIAFICLLALVGMPTISFGQFVYTPDESQTSEGGYTFTACTGTSLTLIADCDGPSAIWQVESSNPYVIESVASGVTLLSVRCNEQEEPTIVTVIGIDCGSCPNPPSATNFHASGTLGSGNCSVQLSATASGRSFQFTGPGGYVFSNVYRSCQENITVYANDVILPGIYYLKVDGGGEPVIYTIEVGGTACPK